MNFNLSNSNGTAIQRLKPWTINKVKFDGVDFKKGTASSGNTWQAIQFKFKGADGIFEHMVFCPGQEGDNRPTGNTGGRDWEMPSQMETLQHTIAHVLKVLNEKGLEKLSGIELELPKDFEKLYQYLKKVLDPVVGKETELKLIGNNKGYASVPYFISINKDTKQSYISNNWLGENLAFTASELNKKQKAGEVKPETPSVSDDSSSDLNLDDDEFDI